MVTWGKAAAVENKSALEANIKKTTYSQSNQGLLIKFVEKSEGTFQLSCHFGETHSDSAPREWINILYPS
jgi:hypothetical protein